MQSYYYGACGQIFFSEQNKQALLDAVSPADAGHASTDALGAMQQAMERAYQRFGEVAPPADDAMRSVYDEEVEQNVRAMNAFTLEHVSRDMHTFHRFMNYYLATRGNARPLTALQRFPNTVHLEDRRRSHSVLLRDAMQFEPRPPGWNY